MVKSKGSNNFKKSKKKSVDTSVSDDTHDIDSNSKPHKKGITNSDKIVKRTKHYIDVRDELEAFEESYQDLPDAKPITQKARLDTAVKANRPIKVSDELLLDVFRKCFGVYSAMSRLLKKRYGIEYTRYAIAYRVKQRPDLFDELNEEVVDDLEHRLFELSINIDSPMTMFKAIEKLLNVKGKKRGYDPKNIEVNTVVTLDSIVQQAWQERGHIPSFEALPLNEALKS
jgi:hypothetical protein